MLDEMKIIEIDHKGKKIQLSASFESFKKLHKATGNAFLIMDEFVNDTQKRVEHLPVLIQSMASEDLTLEEIENSILGMQWTHVVTMSNVIFDLIDKEYIDPLIVEEHSKNVAIPSPESNHQK